LRLKQFGELTVGFLLPLTLQLAEVDLATLLCQRSALIWITDRLLDFSSQASPGLLRKPRTSRMPHCDSLP
jgi:hypothetical protein